MQRLAYLLGFMIGAGRGVFRYLTGPSLADLKRTLWWLKFATAWGEIGLVKTAQTPGHPMQPYAHRMAQKLELLPRDGERWN